MGKFDTHGGYFSPKGYFRVNTGGSHKENPNGGVQIGTDEQGIPNMLEENEPVYDDYVYSDNIKADKQMLKKYNIPDKYAGKLFSEIADKFVDEASERPNDPVSNNGLNAMLVRLANAQEEQKQIQQQKELEKELSALSPEELAALEEMMSFTNNAEPIQEGGEIIPQDIQPEAVMANGGLMNTYGIGSWLKGVGENFKKAKDISRMERQSTRYMSPHDRAIVEAASAKKNANSKQEENDKLVEAYNEAVAHRAGLLRDYSEAKAATRIAEQGQYDAIVNGGDFNAATKEYDKAKAEEVRLKWLGKDAKRREREAGWLLKTRGIVPQDTREDSEVYSVPDLDFDDEPTAITSVVAGSSTGSSLPSTSSTGSGSFSVGDVILPEGWSFAKGGPIRKFETGTPGEIDSGKPFFMFMPNTHIQAPSTFDDEAYYPYRRVVPPYSVSVAPVNNNSSVPEDDISTTVVPRPFNALPTMPRYASGVIAGLTGLYDVFQKPDEYNIPRLNPVLPSARMNLIDPVYNPVDQNMVVGDVLANSAGTTRALQNMGIGPSAGATLLASAYDTGRNIGTARTQVVDANNQQRNNVIAQRNANAQALGNLQYGLSRDRAHMLNDAQSRNIYNDLTRQRLNYEAEGQKYAAIAHQLDQVGQALSGIGRENFEMNQINSAYDYNILPNGQVVFMPKTTTTDRKLGGTLLRTFKKK